MVCQWKYTFYNDKNIKFIYNISIQQNTAVCNFSVKFCLFCTGRLLSQKINTNVSQYNDHIKDLQ